jgi:hypothetical protein
MSDEYAALWAEASKAATAAKGDESGSETVSDDQGTESTAEASDESATEGEAGTEGKAALKDEPADAKAKAGADETEEAADDPNADPTEAAADRDRVRLEALAKRLGYKLEGERVSVEERAEFRAAKRKSLEAIRAKTEAVEAREKELDQLRQTDGAKFQKLLAAVDAADHQAVAELAGFKSWEELNLDFLRKKSSPQSREIEALKKDKREREEREAKLIADAKARETTAKVERERKEYVERLTADIESAEDESIRSLGKVEGFSDLVLHHERIEYDPALDQTITREEAIKRATADARKQYASLHAIFGGGTPVAPLAKGEKAPKRPNARSAGSPALTLDQIDTSTPEGERQWQKAAEQMLRSNA